MDYLRVLLVPFHPTVLLMVAVFSLLLALCGSGGIYGLFGQLFIHIWIFKYCYVLIEHLADGAVEPPVMDTDMLSAFEVRPWIQGALVFGGGWLCYKLGGVAGAVLAVLLLLLLPASIAVLGFGERAYQAVNPLMLYRVIRGLGLYYLLILLAMLVSGGLLFLLARLELWSVLDHAVRLIAEISVFALIGGSLYLRRRQLGFEPSRSPERAAARAENERVKLRAKMIDDVFQLVRLGKHVDATKPLAHWLDEVDTEHVSKDAYYVAEQALRWDSVAALNPLGSTLIRHLMRCGRPDAALAVFEILRARSSNLTLDSAADLRTLADYAESMGRGSLAESMRLETPVFQPPP
jgi:hypothetical protein